MAAFLARRFLLSLGVLAVVSFGSFTLIATKFSATCSSAFTPQTQFPPLAGNVHQAATLYWDWLKSIPGGHGFGAPCNAGGFLLPFWTAVGHTAVLIALTALLVVVCSVLLACPGSSATSPCRQSRSRSRSSGCTAGTCARRSSCRSTHRSRRRRTRRD